jgi:ABC-type bacteriocin/lantibiotic exporter with double-glycine peptidase domain
MHQLKLLYLIRVLCLLILCGGAISSPARAEAPAGLPRRCVLDDVPQYYQNRMECGPVALRMVLEYYDQELSTWAIKEEVWTDDSVGTRPEDLAAYPKTLGLKARAVSGDIDALARSIADGCPVIVRQWKTDQAKQEGTVSHYRVVIGYDYDQQMIYMRDPSKSGLSMASFQTFNELWDVQKERGLSTRNWMLIIHE